jgi:nucleotide-binding universal stress UspA family protein
MKNPVIISLNVNSSPDSFLEFGTGYASTLNAPLLLYDVQFINRIVPTGHGIGNPILKETESDFKEVEQRMQDLCMRMREKWRPTMFKLDRGINFSIAGHDKADYVLNEVEEDNPQLLILENKSTFNWMNEWFGTAETKMAEEADCPVIVVPQNKRFSQPKNIYYLLDNEKLLTTAVVELQFLSKLLELNGGFLSVIYFESTQDGLKQLESEVKRIKIERSLNFKNLGFVGMAEKQREGILQDLISNKHVDLFAFPQRNKSFFERLIDDDNTKRLILKSDIPVLVF